MNISAAIILAAGVGSRMKSDTPKALHTLAGKTFLQRIMQSIGKLNPQILSVVVRHKAEQVQKAALSYNEKTLVIYQDDKPGSGRAVQCAMDRLQHTIDKSGYVLVVACDMPLLDTSTLQQLLQYHEDCKNGATVLTTHLADPTGYGRIIRDEQGNLLRIVEQKDANAAELAIHEVNTSVYMFNVEVLMKAIEGLNNTNAQGEFYLTDALETARNISKVGVIAAQDPMRVEGINDRLQLSNLARRYNQHICEYWMRQGVTIYDPNTTWIDDEVILQSDVTIYPGCMLQGNTSVESHADIGPFTTLINAQIQQGALVERSRVEATAVGECAHIGPWTYLRAGNEISDHTKVGAFVEMKKSHIATGTKVPHLTYIGDSSIGSYTNIGGGTITANYDGQHKHRTIIGNDVHIGAGNMIVAPVQICDNSTTAAGTVIRHTVQEKGMAYSENTQHVVENWIPPYKRASINNSENPQITSE